MVIIRRCNRCQRKSEYCKDCLVKNTKWNLENERNKQADWLEWKLQRGDFMVNYKRIKKDIEWKINQLRGKKDGISNT